MQSNLESLQKQTPEWYDNLRALTGHPGGRPGYWGESHDETGTRIAPLPSDEEWDNAYDELWTAQVTASTMSKGDADLSDYYTKGQVYNRDETYNKPQSDGRFVNIGEGVKIVN